MRKIVQHSLITSIKNYLYSIPYFGNNTYKLRIINFLIMCDTLFEWNTWFGLKKELMLKLFKKRHEVILKNDFFALLTNIDDKYYANVNIPQTIYTFSRVYDLPDINKDSDIRVTENGDTRITENNIIRIIE